MACSSERLTAPAGCDALLLSSFLNDSLLQFGNNKSGPPSLDCSAGNFRLHPHVILLDNMTVPEVKAAVKIVRSLGSKTLLEVSGRVSFEKVRDYAKTGVQRISIGALTHSAPHLDFSLDIIPAVSSIR